MSSRPHLGAELASESGSASGPTPGFKPGSSAAEGFKEKEKAVTPFLYPEAGTAAGIPWLESERDPGGSEARLRAAAVQEGEERARAWYAGEIGREREVLRRAMGEFALQRNVYFQNVEREAVQLTLLIARKILQREARVEPLAVAAMLHVALEPLQAGTAVTLRVHPATAQDWRLHFAAREGVEPTSGVPLVIVEDGSLAQGDCVVETQMGAATISLQQKLEEIEASFLELLAQRPKVYA